MAFQRDTFDIFPPLFATEHWPRNIRGQPKQCHVCVHRSSHCRESGQHIAACRSGTALWTATNTSHNSGIAAAALSLIEHDAEVAAPRDIQLRVPHVPEHDCRPHLQRPQSILDLSLDPDQLRFANNRLELALLIQGLVKTNRRSQSEQAAIFHGPLPELGPV